MRVVIIGGSGLNGQALARELAKTGQHQVTILSRGAFMGERAGQMWQHWDGHSAATLTSLIDGQDAVVNLAGENLGARRWSRQQKERILSSRVDVSQAVAQAVKTCQIPPAVYVQASAVGYYGIGEYPVTEESTAGSDWLAGVCREWEKASVEISQTVKRVVNVRTGVVLERNDGILRQLSLPMQFCLGGPLGSGKQWISWIHLEDEAAALRYLIERETCQGIYNLTAPQPVQQREFGRCLAQVLHRPYWLPLPGWALKLLLGEMSTLALEGQRVLPQRLQQTEFSFQYPELCMALQQIYSRHP